MFRASALRIQRDQHGFTLIELLVVVLIIGVLAAIAIPAFLGQRQRSRDAVAKTATHNAATAAEAHAAGNNGSYLGMVTASLTAIEPSLRDAGGLQSVAAVVGTPTATTYTVSTRSKSLTYFKMTRTTAGRIYRCKGTTSAACATNSGW